MPTKLVWDEIGDRTGETGVDQGVLYPFASGEYEEGVAWSGLTSVSENPTGAEASSFHADNKKYIELYSEEEFAGSIGCFTYPPEFEYCIGEVESAPGVVITQQKRGTAGFSYRTKVVSDTDGLEYGYKIHLVYGAKFGVASREHTTMNESPELEELNFDFTTTKANVTDGKPTAHVVVDTTKLTTHAVENSLPMFLRAIYGDAETSPRLPTPDEVIGMFAAE